MNWHKVSNYCIESNDRRYRVTKATVGDSVLYTRWSYNTQERRWVSGLITADADEAKNVPQEEPKHGITLELPL